MEGRKEGRKERKKVGKGIEKESEKGEDRIGGVKGGRRRRTHAPNVPTSSTRYRSPLITSWFSSTLTMLFKAYLL